MVPSWELNFRRFWRPQSITKWTPGTVTLVSAMFVARIIFRWAGGVAENALCWRFAGRAAYKGQISN